MPCNRRGLPEETIAETDNDFTHKICGDAWFDSVKTAQELLICGFEYIKQYHSLYPKECMEEATMVAPGTVVIVLEGKARKSSMWLRRITTLKKQFNTSLQPKTLAYAVIHIIHNIY